VVVSAEYLADDLASSTPFLFPVSTLLFLPQEWTEDEERRKQAHVPAELTQHTNPEGWLFAERPVPPPQEATARSGN
jgi:hypothetical protein